MQYGLHLVSTYLHHKCSSNIAICRSVIITLYKNIQILELFLISNCVTLESEFIYLVGISHDRPTQSNFAIQMPLCSTSWSKYFCAATFCHSYNCKIFEGCFHQLCFFSIFRFLKMSKFALKNKDRALNNQCRWFFSKNKVDLGFTL